jgi:hypothetical protein
MKTFLITLFLLLSFSGFAQTESEVKEAVMQLGTAMLEENVDKLRSLTSVRLNYGHSSGAIENQEQFLAVFASKKSDYTQWDITDLTIDVPEKNLAVVRHKVKGTIVSSGNTNQLEIGLLMVWTKEKRAWKLLARQAFRLPQP